MTILVVDKVPIYRYGLATFLKNRFTDALVLESERIISFISNDPDETVNLIVVREDSATGSSDGNEVLTARELYPAAEIIVFALTIEYKTVIANLNAGISGYFSGIGELEEFAKCIKEVTEGKKYISQDILWVLLDFGQTKKAPKIKQPFALTAHEHRIAEYYCEGKRTKWIAGQLDRKSSTISTIKANIFRKLRVDNVFQLKLKLQMQEIGSLSQQRESVEEAYQQPHW